MSKIENGYVEAKRRDGKGIKIGDDWYSAYNASQLNGVERGDTVSFEYTQKGSFLNIKGGVTKSEGAAPGHSGGAVTTVDNELPDHYFVSRGYANLKKSFPIPPTHPDRAIIRQNALTNARELLTDSRNLFGIDAEDGNAMVKAILDTALKFEAYTAGDTIREKAEEMMKQFNSEE